MTSSMAQLAQSDLNVSENERPVKCWHGVQVMSTMRLVIVLLLSGAVLVSLVKETWSRLESRQSIVWVLEVGTPKLWKYLSFPKGAKKWGIRSDR